jgi:hypothetical protein
MMQYPQAGPSGSKNTNNSSSFNFARVGATGQATIVEVINPYKTSRTFMTSQSMDSDGFNGNGGGYIADNNSQSKFFFNCNSQTFSGNVRIYGYNDGA